MTFLGIFACSGVHSYMDGMQKSADTYYEENNLQDLWLTGENFKTYDLNKVKNTENVKDANRVLTLTTSLKDFDNVLSALVILSYEARSSFSSVILKSLRTCFNRSTSLDP